jgi:hypothetical protein
MVYSTSEEIGSPSKFYDLLQQASEKMPIARNHEGSYLTFKSVDGLIFAVDLFVAGFSTVWLDQVCYFTAVSAQDCIDSAAGILATGYRFSPREFCQSISTWWDRLVWDSFRLLNSYGSRMRRPHIFAFLPDIPRSIECSSKRSGSFFPSNRHRTSR